MKKVVAFLVLLLCAQSANAQILAEFFSNTDCTNCVVPDNAYDDFMKAHPEYKIIQVIYHNNSPFPEDPFYLASKADVDARQDITSSDAHYNVEGDPVGVINGYFSAVGSSSFPTWKSSTEEAFAAPKLPANVIISGTMSEDGYFKINVKVTVPPGQTQYVLPYIMLTESNIQFANTKNFGNPKSGVWDNIFRAAIPRASLGEPFLLTDTTLHYEYNGGGKGWNLANMKVVAAIQDVNSAGKTGAALYSFPVYGVASSSLPLTDVATKPTLTTSLGDPTPNPASASVSIPFSLTEPSFVRIAVNDMLGREVGVLANGIMSEGNNNVYFAPKEHHSGMYVATMTVNGKFVGSKKIVLQ